MIVMREQVSNHVQDYWERISQAPDRAVKASLARLRRGVGKAPGAAPELWGEFLQAMPENFYNHSPDSPSYAQWAVYIALTLLALHQQGREIQAEPAHQKGKSLGTAAAGLVKNEEDRKRIWRRFYKVAAADDMVEVSYYLRGMVQLLRADGITLDYARLAGDLFDFQFSERADSIRLRWGEDFFRKAEGETDDESESVS